MEKNFDSIQTEHLLKPAAKSHLYSVARLPTRRQETARLSQLEVLASTRSCFALSPAQSFEGGSLGKESAGTSTAAQVPWPRSKQLYELEKIVGMGTTATVYAAFCRQRMETCAVKIVDVKASITDLDEILKDIQSMTPLMHKNIMPYHTVFVDRNELLLVLPLLEQGSIYDVIQRKRASFDCSRGVFDEQTIATMLNGVLSGLAFLHSNGYIHKNIRAENILLGEDGSVKIGEFAVQYSACKNRSVVGSACWMAPEKIEEPNKSYDASFDIWSLGITAIELITGSPPYSKKPSTKVLMLVRLNAPPTLESIADVRDQYVTYGKSIRQLIADCLQKDPQKRPTAAELKFHRFFKKAQSEEFLKAVLAAIPQFEDSRFDTPSERRTRWRQTKKRKWLLPEDFGCIEQEQAEESYGDQELNCAQQLASAASYSISRDFPWPKPSISSGVWTIALKIRGLHFEFPMILKSDACTRRDLYEIKFEFVTSRDTPETVATNLLREGLIDRKDQNLIADNLTKLLKDPAAENVTFKLKSDVPKSETACEWNFIGYASLRIVEFTESRDTSEQLIE